MITRRSVQWVLPVMIATLVILFLAALSLGDVQVTMADMIAVLTGQETGLKRLVLLSWRLPQTLCAIIIGAALALAGAIFQTLTRNPLGSPDVIGFSTGAYTGALMSLLFFGGGYAALAAGAVGGGLITAIVVTLLAYRGGLDGFRLVIVGIGISALLTSLNGYLLLTARVEVARAASVWGIGSLSGLRWEQAAPTAVLLIVAIAAVLPMTRSMHQFELGDTLAIGTGVALERLRWGMVLGGVVLVALATAVTGPIAFVALAAPQIARRITGAGQTQPLTVMLTGSIVLLASDLIAMHAIPGIQLPVGVLTVCVGGVYLVWLLISETRKKA
ncbi:iron-enterobactin transporter permease [Microbacterium saperdae]|uniref:Iron complex transport system permease protein n=2 Tax=Microbacterium saperdae TaxID=69368 RepID=A0A543BL56_9MICO|nr:iron complex transport system permease protein [Microbacterium saperdae]GGM63157.1 iron-enterobactin transporter permease [Microbacterium saperdae]